MHGVAKVTLRQLNEIKAEMDGRPLRDIAVVAMGVVLPKTEEQQ